MSTIKEMVAEKKWDGDGVPLEDSNCAGIGSDEDKALRKEAAQTEPAWEGVGQEPGLWVWRVEDFQVVPWPREKYGKFHTADSYVVLSCQAGEEEGAPLERDVFFWLGRETSIDERGTAAYKTVELDDLFDGACGQNREVQGRESEQFQQLFPKIQYLKGGVESGFDPAQPDVFMSRLQRIRRTKKGGMVMDEVPLERSSLNQRDYFILDAGTTIYAWYGEEASPFLKNDCNTRAKDLESERNGDAEVVYEPDDRFWELLGGEGDITPADAVDDEEEPDFGEGVLYRVSVDEGREISVDEVGRGELDRSMLDSTNVMMLDTRTEIFLWVGREASEMERRNALKTATNYLKTNGRPVDETAIHMLKEGSDMSNKVWASTFPK